MTFVKGNSDATRAITDSYGRYVAMDDVDAHRSPELYDNPVDGCYSEGGACCRRMDPHQHPPQRLCGALGRLRYSNFAPSTTASRPLPLIYVRADN